MSRTQVGAVLDYLRKLAADQNDVDLPDHQLLERFAAHRDEAAFAVLLKRHGPMVLGVCKSVLHHQQDAEDAFQAAFLVLAQKAGSIHRREAVSGWLHRVAYHLAVDVKASAARRRVHEQRAAIMPPADPVLDMSLRELRGIVNEELQRLPEQLRAPLVLCGLEEKTLEEAARLLGWTKGTVKGRLQRGRERLRQRLRRRGLDVSAGLLAVALSTSSASARISAALAAGTLRAALRIAAGERLTARVVSAQVAALVQGASQTMFLSKAKIMTMLLLALSVSIAGLGAFCHRDLTAQQADTDSKQTAKPAVPIEKTAQDSLTVRGRVLDPDGQPFAGATQISGLTAKDNLQTLKSAEFNVSGLFPGRSRHLVCYHKDKDLGASLVIRGDERGPIVIRLQPCGEAVGRIVDKGGQPVADLSLLCESQAGGPSRQVVTDRSGQFRVKSLVSGLKYDLLQLKGVMRWGLTSVVDESGKTKELGDIRAYLDE